MSETSPAARPRRSGAEMAALAGLLALVVAVPLAPLDLEVAGYRIADLVTVLLPLAVLAGIPFLRRLGAARLPALRFELAGVAFLALALPSVVFAASRGGAVLSWIRFALYLALALVAAAVLHRRDNRRIVLWVFAGVAVATVLVAARQLFDPSTADLAYTAPGEPTRVFATFVNPNFFSEYLVLAIAVCLALFFLERKAGRVIAVAIAVGCALALIVTYTRGSWLALAVGVVAGAVMVDLRLAWVVLGGGAALLAVIPSAWRRLLSVFTVEGSSAQRVWLWGESFGVVKEHPLVGVGLGGYSQWIEATRGAAPALIGGVLGAHESYLQMTAEVGVPGGLAFLVLAGSVALAGFGYARVLRDDGVERGVNAALTVGLVAFAVNAFVSNSFHHPQAAVFFWMLAGMQAAAAGRGAPLRFRPVTGSRMSRIVFGNGAADAPDLAEWDPRVTESA